ncbi:MAG: DNRLRE domain-containing protein [Bacteroidales bacterium]|nr:DNRLRE domain-containing protein [Bacteroidales bacterium]
MKLFISLLLAVPFSINFLCSQTILVLQPGPEDGKDGVVHTLYPNTNLEVLKAFRSDSWTTGGVWFIERSFIEFDLSALPGSANVVEAKLSLYSYYDDPWNQTHSTLQGTNESWLRKVITEWDEFEITWENQPQVTNVNQILLPASTYATEDYLDIDVTNLILEMINDPENSFGFRISLRYEHDYRRLAFASSDHEDTAIRPKLEITFYESTLLADFTYTIDDLTVQFVNLSQHADSYLWDFGDGIISQNENPTHQYTEIGEYDVTLIAYNDILSNTITKTLTVCKMPISAFDFSIDGYTLSFSNLSQDADTYFWTFGDGNQSTLENPTYTYSSDGEYIVSLVATNVCGADTINKTISICKLPVADFEFNQPTGHEISFINKSLEYESCYWYFGDGCGSFDQNPTHIYNQQGDYKVKLIVNNYCGADSLTKFISISVDWPYEERLFFIYPNPTRGLLTLKLINVNPVDAKIDLFNYRGKFIKSYTIYIDGEATIDLSEFSSGIYILKLQSDLINNRYKKVVKLF